MSQIEVNREIRKEDHSLKIIQAKKAEIIKWNKNSYKYKKACYSDRTSPPQIDKIMGEIRNKKSINQKGPPFARSSAHLNDQMLMMWEKHPTSHLYQSSFMAIRFPSTFRPLLLDHFRGLIRLLCKKPHQEQE